MNLTLAVLMAAFAGQPDGPATQPETPAEAEASDPNAALRAERDRLIVETKQSRVEIEMLRAALAEAQERQRVLDQDYASVREQLAAAEQMIAAFQARTGAGVLAVAPVEARAPVPADPLASPASMLADLQARYVVDFGSTVPDDAEALKDYHDRLKDWVRVLTRDVNGRTMWLVTIGEPRETEAGRFEARVRVIDEASGLPIGDPFVAEVPRTFVNRIREGEFERWNLTVAMSARPRLNRERRDEGVFNVPPLVGPFVEFGFAAEWKSLVGVKDEAAEAPAGVTPGTSEGRER